MTESSLIVVDLANLRDKSKKVRIFNRRTEEHDEIDAFSVGHVLRFMEKIESLNLSVPVIYLVDAGVKPDEPLAGDREMWESLKVGEPDEPRRILTVYHEGAEATDKPSSADYPIIRLVNMFGAVVVSKDKFRDHAHLLENEMERFPWELEIRRIGFRNSNIADSCRQLSDEQKLAARFHALDTIVDYLHIRDRPVVEAWLERNRHLVPDVGELPVATPEPVRRRVLATWKRQKAALAEPVGTDAALTSPPPPPPRVPVLRGPVHAELVQYRGRRIEVLSRLFTSDRGEWSFELRWFGSGMPIGIRSAEPRNISIGEFVRVIGECKDIGRDTWVIDVDKTDDIKPLSVGNWAVDVERRIAVAPPPRIPFARWGSILGEAVVARRRAVGTEQTTVPEPVVETEPPIVSTTVQQSLTVPEPVVETESPIVSTTVQQSLTVPEPVAQTGRPIVSTKVQQSPTVPVGETESPMPPEPKIPQDEPSSGSRVRVLAIAVACATVAVATILVFLQ